MNFLPSTALAEILSYDQAAHVAHGYANRNRFYLYLLPVENDMEIHTVACRADKRGVVAIKEVARDSVDDPWIYFTDVAFCGMGGYVVNWHKEGVGPERPWDYKGHWESETYGLRCMWKIHGPLVNPEALQAHPRFKYCAYNAACGHILDYLKVYAKHPQIELLSKAGLERFGCKVGFVQQMKADKGLSRFVLQNLEEIKSVAWGVDVIRKAYKDGTSLQAAGSAIAARHEFKSFGGGLPKQIDAVKALDYIKAQRTNSYQFAHYIRAVATLGLDLADSKNVFPHHFKQRNQIITDQLAEHKRRENAKLAVEQDTLIASAAKRFAKLERSGSSFRMRLPRCTADLVREGQRLHNCLGDGHYAAKMARGETAIAFVRRSTRPSAAFVAVEFVPHSKKLLQCYAAKNSRPSQQVLFFVNRSLQRIA
jgi:hypothetical protein